VRIEDAFVTNEIAEESNVQPSAAEMKRMPEF